MPTNEFNEVRIHLNVIEELFAEPEANPFDPNSRFISGIDELFYTLRRIPVRKKIRVFITLPDHLIGPDLEEKTRAALTRFCIAKIEESRRETDKLRRLGRRALVSAVAVILVTLLLATLITGLDFLNDNTKFLFSQGLIVFGWVTLWYPANIFLYDWRPHARARVGFEKLRDADLVIEPTPY
jgi:hypothetical protein